MKEKLIMTEVANYFNEVNHFSFTREEINEAIEEGVKNIKQGNREIYINALEEEFLNSEDKEALSLIEKLRVL